MQTDIMFIRPHNSYTWVINTDYRLTLPQIEAYTFNKHLPFIAEKNQLFTCYLIFFYKNDINWYFIHFCKLINGSTMMNLSVAFIWSDLRRKTATTVQHKLFQASTCECKYLMCKINILLDLIRAFFKMSCEHVRVGI